MKSDAGPRSLFGLTVVRTRSFAALIEQSRAANETIRSLRKELKQVEATVRWGSMERRKALIHAGTLSDFDEARRLLVEARESCARLSARNRALEDQLERIVGSVAAYAARQAGEPFSAPDMKKAVAEKLLAGEDLDDILGACADAADRLPNPEMPSP